MNILKINNCVRHAFARTDDQPLQITLLQLFNPTGSQICGSLSIVTVGTVGEGPDHFTVPVMVQNQSI